MQCAHVKRLNPIRSLWHINDHINPITLFSVHVNTTFGFDNRNEFIRMEAKSVHVNVAIESVSKQQENLTVLDRYGCWAAELHTLHHASVKTRERGKMSVSHPCIWTDRWKPKPRVTALWFPWIAPTDLQKTHLYVSTDASQFVFSLRIRQCAHGTPTIPSLSMWSCILRYADKTGNYFVDGKL